MRDSARGSVYWNRTCKDYAVLEKSPAISNGFIPIEVEKIGLTPDFPFDQHALGRIDGVKSKIQAERYQRMHGLWHTGSTGISPGFGFAPEGAWARFDNVNLECGEPCSVVLRMKAMPRGTTVHIALGSPDHVLGSTRVAGEATLGLVTVQLKGNVVEIGATVFLLLEGECHVDWFQFSSGVDVV